VRKAPTAGARFMTAQDPICKPNLNPLRYVFLPRRPKSRHYRNADRAQESRRSRDGGASVPSVRGELGSGKPALVRLPEQIQRQVGLRLQHLVLRLPSSVIGLGGGDRQIVGDKPLWRQRNRKTAHNKDEQRKEPHVRTRLAAVRVAGNHKNLEAPPNGVADLPQIES